MPMRFITSPSKVVLTHPGVRVVLHTMSKGEQASISFRELESHSLVLFPTGNRPNFVDKVIELCSCMGFTPDISQVVGDAVTGVALVCAGLRWLERHHRPEIGDHAEDSNGVCRLFESKFPADVDLSCVYRKEDPSAILRTFLAVIEEFKTSWNEQDQAGQ